MSLFYKSLPFYENWDFKKRKQRFKRNKPCAICGKQYNSDEMMVAHIIPVRELSTYQALYDKNNWQVRCIYCERRLNREEELHKQIQKHQVEQQTRKLPPIPSYEVQVYTDYDDAVTFLVKDAERRFGGNLHKVRRKRWEQMIHKAVSECDRILLAKGAARLIITNSHVPTYQEITQKYESDVMVRIKFKYMGERRKNIGE